MSLLKSSFSMCSLKGARMESLTPDMKINVERPYNSLSRMPRKNADKKEKWRRSWGSSSTPTKDDNKDFWDVLKVHYNFIMDNQLIDTCNETNEDFNSECPATPVSVWSLTEFMKQYNELMSLLNTIQNAVYGDQEVLAEKSVRREQIEELNKRAYQRKLYNEQALSLKSKYPNMSDEITWRSGVLNTKWEVLEQVITPRKLSPPEPLSLPRIETEIRNLKKWLRKTERKLEPLKVNKNLGWLELNKKALEHELVQNDIKSREKSVYGVVKLCDRLATDCTAVKFCNTHNLEKAAINIQKRWRTLYLKSLETQILLEELIKNGPNVDDLPHDHDPEDEPVRKLRRLTGEFNPLSYLVLRDVEGFLCPVNTEEKMFRNDDSANFYTDDMPKTLTGRSTNDIGVMVGRTGLDLVKKCCRSEAAQDVGYSSESSTQLSTDEKCDTIKVYSFDATENVLSLVQTSSGKVDSPSSKDVINDELEAAKENALDISGISYLDSQPVEEGKKKRHGNSLLLESDRPGPNIGTFDFRHIDTESEAESCSLDKSHRVKTKLDFNKVDHKETSTEAEARHQDSCSVGGLHIRSLPVLFETGNINAQDGTSPMVDETSYDLVERHLNPSNGDFEKSYRIKEWLSKSQVSDSCDASGEYTTDASDEISCDSEDENSKSTIGHINNESSKNSGKRRRLKLNRRSLSEFRAQTQPCQGATRSLPESDLLSRNISWDSTRILDSFPSRVEFSRSKISNNESSSENPIYGKFVGEPLKSTRRKSFKPKGVSKSSSFPGSGSGSRKNSSIMSGDTCQSETYCNDTDSTCTTDLEATVIQSDKSLNIDKDNENLFSQSEAMSSVSEQAWDPYLEPYTIDSYEESLDADTASRLLSFGDDYDKYFDGLSDGTSWSREPTPGKYTKLLDRTTVSQNMESDSDIEDLTILVDSRKQLLDLKDIKGLKVLDVKERAAIKENIRCLEMIERHLVPNHRSQGEVQSLLKAWKSLSRQLASQSPQSQFHLLQDSLQKMNAKLFGIKEDLNFVYSKSNLKSPTDFLLLIKNIKTCLHDLEDQKTVIMQINCAVHNYMIETNSDVSEMRASVDNCYKVWGEISERGNQELSDLEKIADKWNRFKCSHDEFMSTLHNDRQILDVLTISANVPGEKGISMAMQEESFTTLVEQAKLLGSTTTSDGDFQLSDREDKMSSLKSLANDLVTILPPDSPLLVDIIQMNKQVGDEFKNLQRECKSLLTESAMKYNPRFLDLKGKPGDWSDLSSNDLSKSGSPTTLASVSVSRKDRGKSWAWFCRLVRVAFPLQIAFVVMFCLGFLMEPNCCENFNNYHMSLSPGLKYSYGRPPI